VLDATRNNNQREIPTLVGPVEVATAHTFSGKMESSCSIDEKKTRLMRKTSGPDDAFVIGVIA